MAQILKFESCTDHYGSSKSSVMAKIGPVPAGKLIRAQQDCMTVNSRVSSMVLLSVSGSLDG